MRRLPNGTLCGPTAALHAWRQLAYEAAVLQCQLLLGLLVHVATMLSTYFFQSLESSSGMQCALLACCHSVCSFLTDLDF